MAALTLPKVPLPRVLPKSRFKCTYDIVADGAGTVGVEGEGVDGFELLL